MILEYYLDKIQDKNLSLGMGVACHLLEPQHKFWQSLKLICYIELENIYQLNVISNIGTFNF